MAKMYVVYKLDTQNDCKYYLLKEAFLLDSYTQKRPKTKIEVTTIKEDAKLFNTLQDANEFIVKYNKKKVSWYTEDIEVRLRRSKVDKTDNLKAIREVLDNESQLVTGEDGVVYIAVDLVKEVMPNE